MRSWFPHPSPDGVADGADGLTVTDLHVGYGDADVVKGVDLTIPRGSVVAIVGPNGAGKSTLAKGVAGVLTPSAGQVWLAGTRIEGKTAAARAQAGIGYVPQTDFVFPGLTVRENLLVGGYRLGRHQREQGVEEVVEAFPRLQPFLSRPAGALSGGEQRLVGLTRALVARPTVLLLDEPTAALEPRATTLVWEAVEQLRHAGLALGVVEQRTDDVLEVADRGMVLVNGECVLEDTASALLNEYNLGEIFLGLAPSKL